MKKWIFLFLFCQVAALSAVDFSVFDSFQGEWTKVEIEERLQRYLQKKSHIARYITLTEEEFILYDLPETQSDRSVEYRLKLVLEPRAEKKKVPKRTNLVGVKIAVDPGHLGGPYARLEERFIDIPPSLERGESIQFDEGTLTFLTAMYLKILLEKEGAIVMMTRDQIGKNVFSESFFDWLKNKPNLWAGEVSLNKLFRKYYNPLDLRARANKINAFAPDLSIVIHYNSHEGSDEISSNHCVVSNNFNMVFIPGAFCSNELVEQESRFEFLRLLITNDLTHSHDLSLAILEKFGSCLQVPIVTKIDGARYLQSVCLKVEEGVYARNLALTRLIHGPVCYGETLVQNNIDECQNLGRQDFVIHGMTCSSRIKEVAEAYFEGIKLFLCD